MLFSTGKRYNSKTIGTANKETALEQVSDEETEQLKETLKQNFLGKNKQKYSKMGGLGISGAQKTRGKHYGFFIFEFELQALDIKAKYKQTREYTGDDKHKKKGLGRGGSDLFKTKHELILTFTGELGSLMGAISSIKEVLANVVTVAKEREKGKEEEQEEAKKQVKKDNIEHSANAVADMTFALMNTIGTGNGNVSITSGMGIDFAHELKWKKDEDGKDIIKEKKTEIDLRNVREAQVKIGQSKVKVEQRKGFLGTIHKQKLVTEPESGETKLIREDLYKKIEGYAKDHPIVKKEIKKLDTNTESGAKKKKKLIENKMGEIAFGKDRFYPINIIEQEVMEESGETQWKTSTELGHEY